jgi:hypothetical protein
MRSPRFSLRALFTWVTLIGCLLSIGMWVASWDRYEYASFTFGHGRRIVITAETFWEISQGLCYEVYDGGALRVPRTFFAVRDPGVDDPDFRPAIASNDALVAVYDRRTPYEIIIIHDFRSGQSLACDGEVHNGIDAEQARRLWPVLRRRIELEHPKLARLHKLRDEDYLSSTDQLILAEAGVSNNDLAAVDCATSMRILDLSHNSITDDGLIHVRNCHNLNILNLTGNSITGVGFRYLCTLNITRLVLNGTNVDDPGLTEISKIIALNDLHLDGTQVTDSGLVHLHVLRNLRFVSLRHTRVTAQGAADLKKALQKAHIAH